MIKVKAKRRLVAYVAGPLTAGDAVENVKRAHAAGLELLRAGFAVIVPHGSAFWGNDVDSRGGFGVDVLAGGVSYEDWIEHSLEVVSRCDLVVRLDGFSRGGDAEVSRAREEGKPVYYSVAEAVAAIEKGSGVKRERGKKDAAAKA